MFEKWQRNVTRAFTNMSQNISKEYSECKWTISIEGGNKKCKYVSTNVMVSKLAKIVLKSKQLKADVYRMGITERKKWIFSLFFHYLFSRLDNYFHACLILGDCTLQG